MIIYGSMLCPDCVQCRKDLDASGTAYDYREITEDLRYMKEFLKIRDENTCFDSVKTEGKIGIPCIVREDGSVSLEW